LELHLVLDYICEAGGSLTQVGEMLSSTFNRECGEATNVENQNKLLNRKHQLITYLQSSQHLKSHSMLCISTNHGGSIWRKRMSPSWWSR
jgi:hypothetical protein